MDYEIDVLENEINPDSYVIRKIWYDQDRLFHREGDRPAVVGICMKGHRNIGLYLAWYEHGKNSRKEFRPSLRYHIFNAWDKYFWKVNGEFYNKDYEPHQVIIHKDRHVIVRFDKNGEYHSIDEYDRKTTVNFCRDTNEVVNRDEKLFIHGKNTSINDCPASIQTTYFNNGEVQCIRFIWKDIDEKIHRGENKPAIVIYERNSIHQPIFYIFRYWYRFGLADRTDLGPCRIQLRYNKDRTATKEKSYYISGSMMPYEKYILAYYRRCYSNVMEELRLKPGVGIDFYMTPMKDSGWTEEELREWYSKNH